jgi:hypothetical protein
VYIFGDMFHLPLRFPGFFRNLKFEILDILVSRH